MDILIILILIAFNGVFAMSEIALVSARKGRLEQAAARGDKNAAAALALAASPTRFLSTVQIGITMIGIFAGAYGEAAISSDLESALARVEVLKPYSRLLALAIVVLSITYLSLVFGELLPKRLAMGNPERIASFMAPPMRFLSRVAAPAVWFLTHSTDFLLSLFGTRHIEEHAVTQEDIKGMVEQAAETGAVHRAEQELVERVFKLGNRRVKSLMVPRADIEWLDAAEPIELLRIAVATSLHSHYPVCRGGLDKIVGIVHVKDVIKNSLVSDRVDLTQIARPPLFVPESTVAIKVLDTLKRTGAHVALVVDEYGALQGLITLNDLVESIIGAVTNPAGDEEPLIIPRDENSWYLDGSLPIDQLFDLMGLQKPDEREGHDYETLSGLLMAKFGHIPKPGEGFDWAGFRFEVADMDAQRVDKVLLVRTKPPEKPPAGEE